jgi:pimeloyl-ACP methyl ester carboxylesterase
MTTPTPEQKSTNGRTRKRRGVPWATLATQRALLGLDVLAPALAGRMAARLMCRTSRRPMEAWERGVTEQSERWTLDGPERIAVYRWGRGPIVLLVHGWNGRGSQLGAFVEPLVARGFQVVAFDAPGHGASAGSESSIVKFADAFDTVVDAVRPFFRPIHGVIAHSMGGAAVSFALGRATNGGSRAGGLLREGALERGRLAFIAPPIDIRSFATDFSNAFGLGARTRAALDDVIEQRLRARLDDVGALRIAARMDAPLLVLHDEDDRAVPVACGRLLADAWPGARLRVTRGLGHSRILRDPESVSTVVEFLNRGPSET